MDLKTAIQNLNWLSSLGELFATLFGVLAALWLDRWIAEKKKVDEKIAELSTPLKALSYVSDSIIYNKDHLISLKDTLDPELKSLKIILPLDLATWDEFQNIINNSLTNIDLRHELSNFYMVSSYVMKLQDRFFNYCALQISGATDNKKARTEIITAMVVNLQGFSKQLLNNADRLLCDIRIEKLKLEGEVKRISHKRV